MNKIKIILASDPEKVDPRNAKLQAPPHQPSLVLMIAIVAIMILNSLTLVQAVAIVVWKMRAIQTMKK